MLWKLWSRSREHLMNECYSRYHMYTQHKKVDTFIAQNFIQTINKIFIKLKEINTLPTSTKTKFWTFTLGLENSFNHHKVCVSVRHFCLKMKIKEWEIMGSIELWTLSAVFGLDSFYKHGQNSDVAVDSPNTLKKLVIFLPLPILLIWV